MNHCDQVRRDILRLLLQRGHRGATDFEICERLELPGDTVRPRRCELRDRGLIIDLRRRRKSDSQKRCIVWIVAPGVNTLRAFYAKPNSLGAARRPSSPPDYAAGREKAFIAGSTDARGGPGSRLVRTGDSRSMPLRLDSIYKRGTHSCPAQRQPSPPRLCQVRRIVVFSDRNGVVS